MDGVDICGRGNETVTGQLGDPRGTWLQPGSHYRIDELGK